MRSRSNVTFDLVDVVVDLAGLVVIGLVWRVGYELWEFVKRVVGWIDG